MKQCKLLVTTEKGAKLAGVISLVDGKLATSATEGFGTLVDTVLGTPVFDGDKPVESETEPEKWFEGLPRFYNGSYLRAEISGMEKRHRPKPSIAAIDPNELTPQSHQAIAGLRFHLERTFERQADKAERAVSELIKATAPSTLQKPYSSVDQIPSYVPKPDRKQWMDVWNSAYDRALKDGMSAKEAEAKAFREANGVAGPNAKLAKTNLPKSIAKEIYRAIREEWKSLPAEARDAIDKAGKSGSAQGLYQLDITDTDVIADANRVAQDYAVDRAAELVGMKYDEEGRLIENPSAKWAISETTRDKIHDLVTDAFEQNTNMDDLRANILSALRSERNSFGIFSPSRADMIARTEVQMAQIGGNFAVWEESGLVQKIKWGMSADHEITDECDLNDGKEVKLGERFPSGDLRPPAHPRCMCVVWASKIARKTEGPNDLLKRGSSDEIGFKNPAAGHWVTINGAHVFIVEGVVVDGPKHLLGHHIEEKPALPSLKQAEDAGWTKFRYLDRPLHGDAARRAMDAKKAFDSNMEDIGMATGKYGHAFRGEPTTAKQTVAFAQTRMAYAGIDADLVDAYPVEKVTGKREVSTEGWYDREDRHINLSPVGGSASGVYMHEYGHHIENMLGLDARGLFSKQFREDYDEPAWSYLKEKRGGWGPHGPTGPAWNEYYEKIRKIGADHLINGVEIQERAEEYMRIHPYSHRLPSSYAMTNGHEWFAECWAKYFRGARSRKLLQGEAPRTYKLIDDIAKGRLKKKK